MTREEQDRRMAELDDWSQGDLMLRVTFLEAALRECWSLSMAAQAEIDNDWPSTSLAEINGRLVEIAEKCEIGFRD